MPRSDLTGRAQSRRRRWLGEGRLRRHPSAVRAGGADSGVNRMPRRATVPVEPSGQVAHATEVSRQMRRIQRLSDCGGASAVASMPALRTGTGDAWAAAFHVKRNRVLDRPGGVSRRQPARFELRNRVSVRPPSTGNYTHGWAHGLKRRAKAPTLYPMYRSTTKCQRRSLYPLATRPDPTDPRSSAERTSPRPRPYTEAWALGFSYLSRTAHRNTRSGTAGAVIRGTSKSTPIGS
jgi:hypothetical protein